MNVQVLLAYLVGTGIEFLETAVIAYALARSGAALEAISGIVNDHGL